MEIAIIETALQVRLFTHSCEPVACHNCSHTAYKSIIIWNEAKRVVRVLVKV